MLAIWNTGLLILNKVTMKNEILINHGTANSDLGAVSGSIIFDLEARIYSLSLQYPKMKVGEFKNIKEVKDIMTAIAVLEKYYR